MSKDMQSSLADNAVQRQDLVIIAKKIHPASRVLDLGCGDGSFLKYLKEQKQCRVCGIEINPDKVAQCISNGVPVIQGDLNESLDFAGDSSFDYVILSRTLQEVLRPDQLLQEIVRVGNHALVSFLNFGLFINRWQFCLRGRMPLTGSLPHEWYITPNIHLGTLKDFQFLCRSLDIEIESAVALNRKGKKIAPSLANLFAQSCVFELRKVTGQ